VSGSSLVLGNLKTSPRSENVSSIQHSERFCRHNSGTRPKSASKIVSSHSQPVKSFRAGCHLLLRAGYCTFRHCDPSGPMPSDSYDGSAAEALSYCRVSFPFDPSEVLLIRSEARNDPAVARASCPWRSGPAWAWGSGGGALGGLLIRLC